MAEIRVIADGLRFPEGPVAMGDGSVILGEIAGSAVTRIARGGAKSPIGNAGGGPNGLATGPDGALYVCNNGGNEYAQGGFLSTGPAKDYRAGYYPADRSENRRCTRALQRVQRPQTVSAERYRV